MRRLLGFARRDPSVLELTRADLRRRVAGALAEGGAPDDLKRLSREVEAVADYVKRLRREIGRLRLNQVLRDHLPDARTDIEAAKDLTGAAAEGIISTAEGLLAELGSLPEQSRAGIEAGLIDIIQACSFQDANGQRLSRALSTLGQIEKRLDRFSRTVKIPDALDTFDRDHIVREARREILLIGGTSTRDDIGQADVDRLFG